MNKLFLCLIGSLPPEFTLRLVKRCLIHVQQYVFQLIGRPNRLESRVTHKLRVILLGREVRLRPIQVLLHIVAIVQVVHVGRRAEARELSRLPLDVLVGVW